MLLLIIHAKTPFERIKLVYVLLAEAGKIFFRRGIYSVREYQAEGGLNALNQIAEAMTKNQKRGINKWSSSAKIMRQKIILNSALNFVEHRAYDHL